MKDFEVSWSELKNFIDTRTLPCQWLEFTNFYLISAFDGPLSLSCRINKDNSAAQTEFETSYKSSGNTILAPSDTDGAPLQRTKLTKTGWHFQCHSLEFTTAKLNSIYNSDDTQTNLTFTNIKYYDNTDTELVAGTQLELTTSCVKTVITFEQTYDFEVIGGTLYQGTQPAVDVRFWVTAVPDLSVANGGSVPFCQGGANLRHMGTGAIYDIDGKTPKFMPYDATYHTNKFEVTLTHPVGHQHTALLIMKLFRENA